MAGGQDEPYSMKKKKKKDEPYYLLTQQCWVYRMSSLGQSLLHGAPSVGPRLYCPGLLTPGRSWWIESRSLGLSEEVYLFTRPLTTG